MRILACPCSCLYPSFLVIVCSSISAMLSSHSRFPSRHPSRKRIFVIIISNKFSIFAMKYMQKNFFFLHVLKKGFCLLCLSLNTIKSSFTWRIYFSLDYWMSIQFIIYLLYGIPSTILNLLLIICILRSKKLLESSFYKVYVFVLIVVRNSNRFFS